MEEPPVDAFTPGIPHGADDAEPTGGDAGIWIAEMNASPRNGPEIRTLT